MEIIESLMHADKDLFIPTLFFSAASIYLSSQTNTCGHNSVSRASYGHTDKIIRPTISVSSDAMRL